MALKGRAKIELKNEETGDVQVIEHGNMLTNELTNALTPWLASTCYGYNTSKKAYDDTYANRLSYNTTILEHLMGGILLFADTLDEDASITEVPRGCEITGKASYDAYSGADLARGSYSADESGYQGDLTYKHVWNFTTSQANGTIAALGLTHYLGGELGDGIEDITSEDMQTWNYKYVLNWLTCCLIAANSADFTSSSSSSSYYYYYVALDLANNCMYYTNHYQYLNGYSGDSHFRQTGVIPLKKMRIPLTKVSPFYDYCGNYSVEDVELAIPDEFLEYAQGLTCQYYMAYSDSYCWIVPLLTSVAAGGSFKVLRVPHDDITAAETLTVTNGTDYPLYIHYCARFTDDYVFGWLYKDSEYYLCRISLSDGGYALSDAPLTYINSSGETALTYSNAQHYAAIVSKNWWYLGCGSNTSATYPVVDIDTMHVKHSQGTITATAGTTLSTSYGVHPGTLRRLTGNIYAGFVLGANCIYLKIFLASDSLLTINNLDEAVVKTASQSMKITYTIQEVEETDE